MWISYGDMTDGRGDKWCTEKEVPGAVFMRSTRFPPGWSVEVPAIYKTQNILGSMHMFYPGHSKQLFTKVEPCYFRLHLSCIMPSDAKHRRQSPRWLHAAVVPSR